MYNCVIPHYFSYFSCTQLCGKVVIFQVCIIKGTHTYLRKKQWAADRIQQEDTSVPAQNSSPMYNAAIQGWAPGSADVPPMIRPRLARFSCLLPHTGVLTGERDGRGGDGMTGPRRVAVNRNTEEDLNKIFQSKQY